MTKSCVLDIEYIEIGHWGDIGVVGKRVHRQNYKAEIIEFWEDFKLIITLVVLDNL